MGIEWATLAQVAALFLVLGGFFRYVLHVIERSNEIWDARLRKAKTDLETLEGKHDELKDEVHKEYVRRGDLEALVTKLDAVARDVNQLIGILKGRDRGGGGDS